VVTEHVERFRPQVTTELSRGNYPFPPELILAVIQAESGGTPGQVNPKSGASGLMQIMPIALKDYNQRNKTKLKMDDMKAKTSEAIFLQIRVGIDILGQYWKQAYKFLEPRLTTVQLDDLGPVSSIFYVAGQGAAKKRLAVLEHPTFAAIAKRYPEWNALAYARKVWRLTADQNPVWDLDAIDEWVGGETKPVTPPLIAKTPQNGFLLAMLLVAIASFYMKKG